MKIANLRTLADQTGGAKPKTSRILVDRIAYKREKEKRALEFRLAVWKRDGGICQRCERHCRRTREHTPERGEVHHKRGRNVAPEDRYNVDAAILLCLKCHSKVQTRAKTP